VLRDWRFYLILIAVMAPSFVVTGLFFHQVHVAAAKGWSLAWLASCFIAYALASTAAALALGPLIDRFGAVRILPCYLPPLGVGLILLAAFDHPATALFYMIALALTSGGNVTVVGAVWAEMYGVRSLGAIRALVAAVLVLAAALSPVLMGWAIDAGVTIEAIALACLGYVGLGTALLVIVARRAQIRPSSDKMTAITTARPMR
jgi:MFS family permease